MRIYLDNCRYNRPYDDQTQEKFDYTEWRKNFFDDIDAKEFNESAVNYAKLNPFKPQKKQLET